MFVKSGKQLKIVDFTMTRTLKSLLLLSRENPINNLLDARRQCDPKGTMIEFMYKRDSAL